jgi:hypothetical protein
MEREFSGRSPLPSGPLLIPLEAGEKFHTGRLGTQWKIDGPQTGGRFSVVHHQLPPRTLAAPLHRHHREDEHSYVLTGTFGAAAVSLRWGSAYARCISTKLSD